MCCYPVLAERRLQNGQTAELGSLLDEVMALPFERIRSLDVDDFSPIKSGIMTLGDIRQASARGRMRVVA
jgi:hypothetical protein